MEPQKITDVQHSYDRVAEEYTRRIFDELQHKPFDRQLLEQFAVRVHGLGPVCDLGCGPGHVARYLHERGVPVQGIDLSPAMIAHARQLNPGIAFTQGNMLALDVGDAVWGGIVAFYSLIHIPRADLSTVLRELTRVLRPGGVLLLAFHRGDDTIHLDEWWGHPVSLDTYFFWADDMQGYVRAAGLPWRRSLNARRIRRWNTPVIGCTCLHGSRRSSLSPQGVVNLLPVDLINEHEGARLPGSSLLCGDGKVREFLPGAESVPHLLTTCGAAEEVPSRAEVLSDRTTGGEKTLGVSG